MPDTELLNEHYQGFMGELSADMLPRFLASGRELFESFGARAGQSQSLLDVGGGGGFFSKAFEELGYGPSTYVDLDPESCRFAREGLGLERVIHGDVAELDKILDTQFDFVYSRHVIEHLPDQGVGGREHGHCRDSEQGYSIGGTL